MCVVQITYNTHRPIAHLRHRAAYETFSHRNTRAQIEAARQTQTHSFADAAEAAVECRVASVSSAMRRRSSLIEMASREDDDDDEDEEEDDDDEADEEDEAAATVEL